MDYKKNKFSKTSDTKIMKDFNNYNKKATESTINQTENKEGIALMALFN